MEDFSPHQIGRYKIEKLIGKGGMGNVYIAFDQMLSRTVALKKITSFHGKTLQQRELALNEAKTLAQFSYSSILRVFDIVEEEDNLWIITELIDGVPLDQLSGPQPMDVVLALFLQLLAALNIVHQKNIYHRDIKPQNILIGKDGRGILIDFGVAYTPGKSGDTLTGSLRYIDPRILEGKTVDRGGDLFALGLILVELLSGEAVVPDLAPLPLYHFFTHDFKGRIENLLDGVFPPLKNKIFDLLRLNVPENPDGIAIYEDIRKIWEKYFNAVPLEWVRNHLDAPMEVKNLRNQFIMVAKQEAAQILTDPTLPLSAKAPWSSFVALAQSDIITNGGEEKPSALNADSYQKYQAPLSDKVGQRTTLPKKLALITATVFALLVVIVLFAFAKNFVSSREHLDLKNSPVNPENSLVVQQQNPGFKPSAPLDGPQTEQPVPTNLNGDPRSQNPESRPNNVVLPKVADKLNAAYKDKPLSKQHKATGIPKAATKNEEIATCKVRLAADGWADITIDGKNAGRLPRAEPFTLNAGVHEITFSSPFIEKKTESIKVCDQEEMSFYFNMIRKQ